MLLENIGALRSLLFLEEIMKHGEDREFTVRPGAGDFTRATFVPDAEPHSSPKLAHKNHTTSNLR